MKTIRRSFLFAVFILAIQLTTYTVLHAADTLPTQLSDQEFWKLSSESSEPDGTFRSDNLLSNESYFQFVIPKLNEITAPGRVYMGVGPEQNFTYIAAIKPRMAFIMDIRRGNLELQLMYKALFELSKDRSEFISLLFSKKRPEGLEPESNIQEIFAAFEKAPASDVLYAENLKTIQDHLTKKHG